MYNFQQVAVSQIFSFLIGAMRMKSLSCEFLWVLFLKRQINLLLLSQCTNVLSCSRFLFVFFLHLFGVFIIFNINGKLVLFFKIIGLLFVSLNFLSKPLPMSLNYFNYFFLYSFQKQEDLYLLVESEHESCAFICLYFSSINAWCYIKPAP